MLTHTASLRWIIALLWTVFVAQHAGATTNNPVFFILSLGRLKTSRVDPIVSPGQLSSHVHNFVGMNGINANTTTVEALEKASSCTSAPLTDDKSSYWAPQLYTYNRNGTLSPAWLSFVNAYYFMRGNTYVRAFPRGLKMVAGNATATGPAATRQLQGVVTFVCLNYVNGSSGGPTFPQTACPQGLRTQIMFPSCWNGKSLYEPDMSHVVYPSGDFAGSGSCPHSHKIRLPTLFYEFIWNVGNTNNQGNSSWVLANGDALGYSFHADFFANWNETTLQSAIDECSGSLFGEIEKCPPLARSVDRKAAAACQGESTEPLSAALDYLPGCNIIYNGPNSGRGLRPGCDLSKVPVLPWSEIFGKNAISISTKSKMSMSSISKTTSSKSQSTSTTNSKPGTTAKKEKLTSTREKRHPTRLTLGH